MKFHGVGVKIMNKMNFFFMKFHSLVPLGISLIIQGDDPTAQPEVNPDPTRPDPRPTTPDPTPGGRPPDPRAAQPEVV